MKTIIIIGMIILSGTLLGCKRLPSTEPEQLEATFSQLNIDHTLILASRVETIEQHTVERIEIIDASNKDHILIHIIVSSEYTAFNEDIMMIITPQWTYETKTMTKSETIADPYTPSGFLMLIDTYTELIDYDMFTNHYITNLATSLEQPTFHRTQDITILRGIMMPNVDQTNNINKIGEIRYQNNQIIELHIQLEYGFSSTKQVSNYISGTHYYFGHDMPITFPSLDDFS